MRSTFSVMPWFPFMLEFVMGSHGYDEESGMWAVWAFAVSPLGAHVGHTSSLADATCST